VLAGEGTIFHLYPSIYQPIQQKIKEKTVFKSYIKEFQLYFSLTFMLFANFVLVFDKIIFVLHNKPPYLCPQSLTT